MFFEQEIVFEVEIYTMLFLVVNSQNIIMITTKNNNNNVVTSKMLNNMEKIKGWALRDSAKGGKDKSRKK